MKQLWPWIFELKGLYTKTRVKVHLKNIVRWRLCTIITCETIFTFRIQFFYSNGCNDNNIDSDDADDEHHDNTSGNSHQGQEIKKVKAHWHNSSIWNKYCTSPKFTEKLSRYKGLEIEIIWVLDVKTQIIPVVIGLIKKGPNKVTCRIPRNNNTNEIQKTTMLGTAHVLRNVLCLK